MRLHRSVTVVLLLVSLAFAACGGEGGDAGADPATSLPADAPVYVEFVVRPEGDQRKQMEALASKVLDTPDPGRKIVELLESLDKDGKGGSYETDVKPWLGRRAGVAVTNLTAEEPTFALAIASTDTEAAAELLARESARNKDKKGSYKDTDLWVDEDGMAGTAYGDFVLLASSETELRRAMDAQERKPLADAQRFKKALDVLPEDRVGAIYFDVKRLLDTARSSPGLGLTEKQLLGQLLGGDLSPTALAILAEDDLIAIESRVKGAGLTGISKLFSGLGYFGTTPLVGEVPGDAFASVGIPKLGQTAKGLVEVFGGALGGAVIESQIQQQLGISLNDDVYSWLGDVAIFVRGSKVADLDGGLVIEVTNEDKATTAVRKLVVLAQDRLDLPVQLAKVKGATSAYEITTGPSTLPIYVALGGKRAVIAYGKEAAEDALTPGTKLSDGDLWKRAEASLDGLEPAMVIDGPSVIGLIEQAAGGDAGFAQAKPYLDAIDLLASGSKKEGDVLRSRFTLGVK